MIQHRKTKLQPEEQTDAQAEDSGKQVYSIGKVNVKFEGANAAVAEALTKDVEIDENDPAIQWTS